jgi:hypothetical protein
LQDLDLDHGLTSIIGAIGELTPTSFPTPSASMTRHLAGDSDENHNAGGGILSTADDFHTLERCWPA